MMIEVSKAEFSTSIKGAVISSSTVGHSFYMHYHRGKRMIAMQRNYRNQISFFVNKKDLKEFKK